LATLKQEYYRPGVLALAVDVVEEEEDCQKPVHLQQAAAAPLRYSFPEGGRKRDKIGDRVADTRRFR
jgi:hypothetical protein